MATAQVSATSGAHGDAQAAAHHGTSGTERPLRADARRNQQKLVEAAREVFAKLGGETSMEAIAKQAGVGIGTLYRHFPKRVDVVEALYRSDVDELVAVAETAVSSPDPWAGLAGWLGAFVLYSMSKKILLNELHEAFAKDPQLKLASRERIVRALSGVLERAQHAGLARDDVDAADVMQLIGSMCMSATLTEPQARRLLAMVLDGLRPQP